MCRVTRELPPPVQLPQAMAMGMPAPTLSLAPVVQPSTAINVMVKTADNRIEAKPAVVSRNANVYELGPVIREGKFGSIRIGTTLKAGNRSSEFERQETDRPVALKVYSMDKMRDVHGCAVENPWLEIEIQQIIGQTKERHLVGIIETCIVEQSLYIVLPYFSAGDVLDIIGTRFHGAALPIPVVKKMFQHMIQGLVTLHGLGIVHRDISIENVLYDDATDNFAICDFGMALHVPRDPVTGEYLPLANPPPCGKEGYIPPCLWKRDPLVNAFACDIWSCGIVLFMALTGSAPMQRATEWDPYYQMISQKRLFEMLGGEMDAETHAGLELVQTILDATPCKRPTARDLLSHPWLQ